MNIFTQGLEVCFLLMFLWHEENVSVFGTDADSLPADSSRSHKPENEYIKALFAQTKPTSLHSSVQNKQIDIVKDGSIDSTNTAQKNESVENIGAPVMEGGGVPVMQSDYSKNVVIAEHTTPDSTTVLFNKHDENNSIGSVSDSFANIDHGTGNSSIVARKGAEFEFKQKIVPRKGVDQSNQEISSSTSQENTDENVESDNSFVHKTCVCCSNNTFNANSKNESDYNCQKCCNVTKKNDTSNVESMLHTNGDDNTPQQVNLFLTSLNANVTFINNSYQNISDPTKQDKQHSSLLNTTISPVAPSKKKKPQFTLDVVNDSPANVSAQQQFLPHNKGSNRTDYVVPVVGIILAIPLVIVLIVILYKKGSEFWERRHYRRMDFLIDGMYND